MAAAIRGLAGLSAKAEELRRLIDGRFSLTSGDMPQMSQETTSEQECPRTKN